MTGLAEIEGAVVGDHRHPGTEVESGAGLGHQEIHLANESGARQQVRDVGTEEFGELHEDTLDFARFGKMEFGDLVLQLYEFRRLDVGCLAGGGFPVHETAEFALCGARHGDQIFAFAHGDPRIGVRQPCGLSLCQDRCGFL